MQQKIDAN